MDDKIIERILDVAEESASIKQQLAFSDITRKTLAEYLRCLKSHDELLTSNDKTERRRADFYYNKAEALRSVLSDLLLAWEQAEMQYLKSKVRR